MSTTPSHAPSGERVEVAVAVALQVLDLREELGVRLPAREDRHLVPVRERGVDGVAAEELRPAENEQLHPGYRSIARADRVDAEREGVDGHALVRVVDERVHLEVLRQPQRQPAVRLEAGAAEVARVGDARLEHRHRNAARIELADDLRERLVEG